MTCPECKGPAGHHNSDCTFAPVLERYCRVQNILSAWLARPAEVQLLREATDALNELTAWASAHDLNKGGVRAVFVGGV